MKLCTNEFIHPIAKPSINSWYFSVSIWIYMKKLMFNVDSDGYINSRK